MEPVLRISRRGLLSIVLNRLTTRDAGAIHELWRSFLSGADSSFAPLSFTKETNADDAVCDIVLTGTGGQIRDFFLTVSRRNVLPQILSRKIESLLDNYLRSDYKIDCRGKILDLTTHTHIMGILNVTPDSFSDGGIFADKDRALAHAREMVEAGADIIDIGGESTRPGARPVPEEEELRRIIPLIERLSIELGVPLSVDTYKSSVAKKALEAGAAIVNDISGLRFSPDMAEVVAEYGAALVIMHIKGTPRDMQQNPVYVDLIEEIKSYLGEGIAIAEKAGVDREKIMIDPGIGFGKTLEHNLTILNRLDEFQTLGRPIVLGTSRKKFIGTILDIPDPADRIDGTAATIAVGIERGARVVRVHDVGRMRDVARMTDAIVKGKHHNT